MNRTFTFQPRRISRRIRRDAAAAFLTESGGFQSAIQLGLTLGLLATYRHPEHAFNGKNIDKTDAVKRVLSEDKIIENDLLNICGVQVFRVLAARVAYHARRTTAEPSIAAAVQMLRRDGLLVGTSCRRTVCGRQAIAPPVGQEIVGRVRWQLVA